MSETGYTFTPKDRSRLSSMVACRCPQCRQGEMFTHAPYDLKKFAKMRTECPVCDQDFKIEPGFYFGASYFSYGINVTIIMTFVIIFFAFFNDYPLWYLFVAIFTPILLLVPVTFRVARSFMLHIGGGIHYKPELGRS